MNEKQPPALVARERFARLLLALDYKQAVVWEEVSGWERELMRRRAAAAFDTGAFAVVLAALAADEAVVAAVARGPYEAARERLAHSHPDIGAFENLMPRYQMDVARQAREFLAALAVAFGGEAE